MRIDIEMKGVQRAINRVRFWEQEKINAIKQSVAETAISIQSEAESLAPEDKGNLKNSFNIDFFRKGLAAEISNNAEYAAHVEFGTRPHVIKAKTPKGLIFKAGGRWVRVQEVKHPGTKAQPFLMPAYDLNKKSFIIDIKRILDEG